MTFNRLCSKLILFSSLFLLGACSPKQESSTVQLKFPDWDQVRAKDLARQSKVSSLALPEANLHLVSVNVTGPGMAPIYFVWERENGAPRPEVVHLPNVPRGNDRLVQVLAIYENSGAMAFYYGDQRLNITSDIANADIEVANEALAQNLVSGRLAGRFLSGPNEGYTGVVQLRFNPPSGAPPMVATNSELFSGWGELFAMSTSLVSYTRPDGSKILDGYTNDTHSVFNALNMARAVRIHVPDAYENKSHDNGTYEMRPVKQQRLLVGYFGHYDHAVDSLQRVCVPNPASIGAALDVDDLFKTANPADPTAAPSNPIKWLGRLASGRVATDHAYVEPVLAPGSGASAMGGDGSGSCSSDITKKYSEFLDLTGTNLDHGDEMLGIRGPYGKHPEVDSNSSDVVFAEYDSVAKKIVLEWDYLPGAANALAGSSVFYRTKPGFDVWDDGELRAGEGFRCNALSKLGFAEISVGQAIETAEIPNIQDSTAASSLQILVCPKGHHGLFFHAAAPVSTGGGGSGSGGGIATKLALIGPEGQDDNFKFTNQTCSPFRILALNASDQRANFPSGAQVSLSATAGTYSFHNTPDCSGSLALPVNVSGQYGEMTVFMKRLASGASGATLTVSDISAQVSSRTVSTDFIDDPGANKITLVGPPSVVAHRCYPVDFQTRYIDGTPTNRIAKHVADSISIDLPMGGDPSFYDEHDWNCAGAPVSLAGAVTLGNTGGGNYNVNKRLHFKYTGVGPLTISPTTSHSTFNANIVGLSYSGAQVTQPGSISGFQIMANNQTQANSCMPISVGFYDSNQNPALVVSGTNGGSPVTVNLGTDPAGRGTFHDNMTDCTGTANQRTSTTIPVGSTNRVLYFKPSVSNTTVRLTAASVVPAKNSSFDISVAPELPTHLTIKLQGQSLIGGFAAGPQPILAANVNFPITVYAIKADGSVHTGFNGQLDSLVGPGSFQQISPNPIYFSGGIANVTVRFNTRAGNSSISAAANGGGLTGNTTAFFVEDSVVPQNIKVYQTNTNWIPGQCQPMLLTPHTNEVMNSIYWVGNSAPLTAPLVVNLSKTSGPTTSFFDDPTCGGGPVTQVTIPSGTRGKLIGVSGTATGSMSFDASDNAGVLNMGSGNPNFNSGTLTNPANMVHIIGKVDLHVGACQAYAAVLVENTTGSAATLGVSETIAFSSSLMTYHTDPNCTSAPQSNFTIPAGTTSIMFYGRAVQNGSDSNALIPFSSSNGLTGVGPSPDATLRVF